MLQVSYNSFFLSLFLSLELDSLNCDLEVEILAFSISAAQRAAPHALVNAKRIPTNGIISSNKAGIPKLFQSQLLAMGTY